MTETVVIKGDESASGGADSLAKDVGAVEATLEHVEEKVETVEEKLEETEQKLEAVEEILVWNLESRAEIWNRLENLETGISELKTSQNFVLEALQENEDDQESQTDDTETVENDIPPIVETPEETQTPIQTKKSGNLLTMLWYGRQG